MTLNDSSGRSKHRGSMIGGLVLAIPATGLSLAMAAAAGWQRGGTQTLSLIGASLAILVVLGAHLLPALHHAFTGAIKALVIPVWMLCMALAIYGHAGLFLYSQQQVGTQRATEVVPTPEIRQPKRDISSILVEQEQVKATQARIKAVLAKAEKDGCPDSCAELRTRLERLNGRRIVLAAEVEEGHRFNVAQDELIARQQRAAEDPVAFAVRQSLGVPPEHTNLSVAIVGAVTLEMLACMGWVLVLAPRQAVTGLLPQPAVEPVMETDTFTKSPAMASEVTEFEPEVTRVLEAVLGGLMPKPTVEGVRKLLRCGNEKAREVTRLAKLRLELEVSSP